MARVALDAAAGRRADILQGGMAALLVASLGYVALLPYPFLGGYGPDGVSLLRLVPLALGILLACAAFYEHALMQGDGRGLGFLGAPLLALTGVQALGSVASIEPLDSLAKTGFYALTGVAFFFAARTLDGVYREAVIRAVLVFSAAAGAVSTAEFLVGQSPLYHTAYLDNNPYYLYEHLRGRSFGTLGHPVFMGALFVLGIPCGLHVFGAAKRPVWKALAGLLLAVTVSGLFFTFTRSAYLAAAAGTVVFFRDRITPKSALTGLALVVLLAGLAATSGKVRDVFSRRNPVTEYVQDYEKAHRLRAFGVVARVMGDTPLLGVGVGNYRAIYGRYSMGKGDTRATYATPDNMYLVTLAESGLAGLGLFIFILYRAWSRLDSARRRAAYGGTLPLAGLAMLAGFAFDIFFFDALYVEPVRVMFWTVLGVACREA